MTTFKENNGSIFGSECEALLNPVNCIGVMGKGLALKFKKKFPKMFDAYFDACSRKLLEVGKVFVWHDQDDARYVVCFPTKKHYNEPSEISYIEQGLDDLCRFIQEKKIKSIAVPALGCGLGGLEWKKVSQIIREKLEGIDGLVVDIFPPK